MSLKISNVLRGFKTDIRNLTFISHSDYTNSGYDRGHMAPNYAISRLYGKSAQEDTFLMTNITPQKPNLNQKIWKDLEELEFDQFSQKFKEMWVFTGPVFDENIERLKSSFFVEIPDAFYKIYVGIDDDNELHTLSFMIPQHVKNSAKIKNFITTIDEIEELTKIDFLHKLDDDLEDRLESERNLEFRD
jgi:endonuclease G, mitochondrial